MEQKLSHIKKIEKVLGHIRHRTNYIIEDSFGDFKKHYPETMWSEFNSQSFRSEKFKKYHGEKHILFMGCSETQGCGGPLQDAWSHILYQKISETEDLSGYFNISTIGNGINDQILILLNYIENFGKPDELFFLVPETSRVIYFVEDYVSQCNMRNREELFLEKDFINAHINSILMLRFLESFCKSLDIKLTWSTWWWQEEDIFKGYGFNDYFSLKMKNIEKIILKKYEEYHDPSKGMNENIRKEDGHYGLVIHKYWAQMFYENRKNS